MKQHDSWSSVIIKEMGNGWRNWKVDRESKAASAINESR